MPLSTIFQIISECKPKYLEKTTDLQQVTDKPFYIMLYRVDFLIRRDQTHNFSGHKH